MGSDWKRLTFFIPGIPRGQARARSRVANGSDGKNFVMHHKAPEQAQDEARIAQILSVHAPEIPIAGPVKLWIRVQLPVPASKSQKWKRLALSGLVFPDNKKPDWDNLGKHVCDCCNGVIWGDDVQVIRGTVEKCYSERPGYFVVVEYLQELQSGSGAIPMEYPRAVMVDHGNDLKPSA